MHGSIAVADRGNGQVRLIDSASLRRYCVLACISILTKKLNAGEEYAVKHEGEDGEVEGGEEGAGRGASLQGVLAFEIITSADVWRYILEFV